MCSVLCAVKWVILLFKKTTTKTYIFNTLPALHFPFGPLPRCKLVLKQVIFVF